jgi:hypothetical protein
MTFTLSLANNTVVTFSNVYENNWAASFKNSVTQLIHSISLKFSNNEVVSVQPFRNIIINDKILRESSQDTATNFLPSMLSAKDSIESIITNAGANAPTTGIGETNNRIATASTTTFLTNALGVQGSKPNAGRIERMKDLSFFDPTATTPSSVQQPTNLISFRNFVVSKTATQIVYAITAVIRMDYLHDFFYKTPLLKNGVFDLVINTNAPSTVSGNVTATNANTVAYSGAWTYSNIGGQTMPFQLSEVGVGTSTGKGLAFTYVAPGNVGMTGALQIGNVNGNTNTLGNCRIYCSLVTMSPLAESKYLSNPIRTVKYLDHFVFNGFPTVAAGGSVSQQITANMSRLRTINDLWIS